MQIQVLKSKIHNAIVTDARLDYVGSITIDQNWMDAANLVAGEKVLVVNNTNGERIETYTIAGKRDTGTICLNGAAAHRFKPGDEIIIIGFGSIESGYGYYEPSIIFPHPEDTTWATFDDYLKGWIKIENNTNPIIEGRQAKMFVENASNKFGIRELKVWNLLRELNIV